MGSRDKTGTGPNLRPTGMIGGDPIPDQGMSDEMHPGIPAADAARGYSAGGKIGGDATSDAPNFGG